MAIPKKLAFSTKKEINQLFKQASKKPCSLFLLVFKKKLTGKPQIAVLVGKKISQKATVRNRLKRKFSQALLEIEKNFVFKPVDLVFLPNQQAISKTKQELKKELEKVLKKEGFINVKTNNS